MKNKLSFFVFFASAVAFSGVLFFYDVGAVSAKDCSEIKELCIIDMGIGGTNGEPDEDALNECYKTKGYNFCIIDNTETASNCQTQTTSDSKKTCCEKEITTNKEACLKNPEATHLTDSQKTAHCTVWTDQKYNECIGSSEGEFDLPRGIDGLNQFQGLSISEVIGNFMGTALKILGSIAFAIMVAAGLIWMTAGGNSDKQRKAMDMMLWAGLGVVVILSSATIVKFVFDAFTN